MTTETHSQPQPTQLSYPCTYDQCTSRATWSVSHSTPLCAMVTVCDSHLISVCTGDISYTIVRLAPYQATKDVIIHGITEKEVEILRLSLTLAQGPHSPSHWETLAHGFLLLWQSSQAPPVRTFENGSILINGVEYPLPKQSSISREDIIRIRNPHLLPDVPLGGYSVYLTLGDKRNALLEEGDMFTSSDIAGASFSIVRIWV